MWFWWIKWKTFSLLSLKLHNRLIKYKFYTPLSAPITESTLLTLLVKEHNFCFASHLFVCVCVCASKIKKFFWSFHIQHSTSVPNLRKIEATLNFISKSWFIFDLNERIHILLEKLFSISKKKQCVCVCVCAGWLTCILVRSWKALPKLNFHKKCALKLSYENQKRKFAHFMEIMCA